MICASSIRELLKYKYSNVFGVVMFLFMTEENLHGGYRP